MIIYQVDAFTQKVFYGNSAGVCILEKEKDTNWMQLVAREMNLSETAFLLRGGKFFHLRWFTPTVEVELCGHATLASAHILWETEAVESGTTIFFDTKSGLLSASKRDDWIELDFPVEPAEGCSPPKKLIDALGVEPLFVGKNRFDYLVEVPSEEDVRKLVPDFQSILQIPCRGVIVTSRSKSSDYDFVSRFFAPAAGVNEDPVTGSAHCCLGPFWKDRLKKDSMAAYQESERGGFLRVCVSGDRCLISGMAVTSLRAELLASD